jgi:putative peptidoglycan lipid II flippase
MFTVLNRALNFVVQSIRAEQYGTSKANDYYLIALLIPTIITSSILSIRNVLIPYFTKYENVQQQKAISSLIFVFLIVSAVISLICIFFSNFIVNIIMINSIDGDKYLVANMLRILSIIIVFITLSNIIQIYYIAQTKHFLYSMAAFINSLTILIGMFLFSGRYGINALIYSTIAGAIIQFIILFISLLFSGLRISNFFNIEYFKLLSNGFSVTIFASLVGNLNLVVDKFFGISLAEGSVSIIDYAFRILYLPKSFIIEPILTAIFPIMSSMIHEKNNQENIHLSKFLNIIIWLVLPICIVIFIFSKEIVAILYMRGSFNIDDTIKTSKVLMIYVPTLLLSCINSIMLQMFFSKGINKIILHLELIMLIGNIIGNYIFVKIFGIFGLAVATVLSTLLGTIYLIKKYFKCFSKSSFNILNIEKIIWSSVIFLILILIAKLYIFNNIDLTSYYLKAIVLFLTTGLCWLAFFIINVCKKEMCSLIIYGYANKFISNIMSNYSTKSK